VAPRALTSLALTAAVVVLLPACGGDSSADEERARGYALRVESISDHVYETAQQGLLTLNRLSDGSIGAQAAIMALDHGASEVTRDRERLEELAPPETGAKIADDLAFQYDSLARSLGDAASTATAVSRGGASLRETGRSFGRVVLAYQSGSAALSRALRSAVVEED
jgi:hypothetical protein